MSMDESECKTSFVKGKRGGEGIGDMELGIENQENNQKGEKSQGDRAKLSPAQPALSVV